MVNGRWYATATTLGDGRIMAFSGLNLGGGTNNTVEIYDLQNAGAGWTSPVTAPFSPPLYPRMFLLPNGKVFYTGRATESASAWIFDPAAGSWTQSAATTSEQDLWLRRHPSASAAQLHAESNELSEVAIRQRPRTEIIDLSAASPSWTPGPNMSTGRIQMNAVILPNGKVLAEGGSLNNESPDTPGKRADHIRSRRRNHELRRHRRILSAIPLHGVASSRRDCNEHGQQPEFAWQLRARDRDLYAAIPV